jgi:hypothetical protein
VDGLAPVTHIIDPQTNHTSESEIPYSLPWKEEYGTHIRGGTSALPVPGKDYYLLFFHTRKSGRAKGVDHYFPGAMTLCPNPPFRIRSMSRYPIVVDPSWYEGPWMNKVATYVVYPIGIAIDPEDPGLVVVSIGYQDRDIYIVKFNIDALVKGLDDVHSC